MFGDVDIATNSDSFTLSVASNDNSSLVTPSLLGDVLTLTFAANLSGVAHIEIQATDVDGATVSDTFTVTINSVNDSGPEITSVGSANVAENNAVVLTVTATDSDLPAQTLTFSITGGADHARFVVNSITGPLSFLAAPDFENPTDADGDHVYLVQVTVSDGQGGSTTQNLSVTVVGDGDQDGVNDMIENAAPNQGDGNSDGILDSAQANVT